MKNKKIFIIVFIFLLSISLHSQDYYIYMLFNNRFKAVFPCNPQKINTKSFEEYKLEVYFCFDNNHKIAYNVKSINTGLRYTVNKYRKQFLDNIFYDNQIYKKNNSKIFYFYSILDKKNDVYIYYIYYQRPIEGTMIYHFSKNILYNKKLYTWTISSPNYGNKKFFEFYKDYCKVLY